MQDTICLVNNTSSLLYESAYGGYLFDKIHNENALRNEIAKTLILKESSTIATKQRKLSALYEAKAGDKIKDTWNKFVEFIKSLFGKFMEKITKLLVARKKYLEKYKDIILNKKFKIKLTDPLPGDYSKGVRRCNTVVINMPSSNDIKILQEGDEKKALNIIIKDINYDDAKSLSENVKSYFLGADRGEKIESLDSLNRADLYNFCYNSDKIEQVGKKDIDAITKTINLIQSTITSELSESYIFEADDQTQDKKDDGTAKAGHINTNPINTSVSNDYNKDNKDIKDKAQQVGQSANQAGIKKNTVDTAFNTWKSVCQSVITAKMTAQEAIAKDYMTIISNHVASYVGKKPNDADNENAGNGTDYSKPEQKKPEENK